MSYDNKRIAFELTETALGNSYYGNVLYEALEHPSTPNKYKSMLHRYLHGSELSTDFHDLQDLAVIILIGE